MSQAPKKKGPKAGFRILEMPFLFEYLVRLVRTIWEGMWKRMMAEMAPSDEKGSFQRQASRFRERVESSPEAKFPAESGRYVLFIGEACPWCHRVMLARALKGLEASISVLTLEPSTSGLWLTKVPYQGLTTLRDVYRRAEPQYRGRFTAPMLLDTKSGRIVCNESSDLLAIINTAFNAFAKSPRLDLRPQDLVEKIDSLAAKIYSDVNNGVYACGFARTQEAYDQAAVKLFAQLDQLETMLETGPFLLGKTLSEVDVRLFPSIFRFDEVYGPLFRCGMKTIEHDYPKLREWLRMVYQLPGVADCSDLEATRQSYFRSLFPLNPGGIVPLRRPMDLYRNNRQTN